ncbi:MAG: WD40 repeat domain-containing protein [Propionibacterium sp.]|nr:WD40 repeat domain-containing protein [Propionibacterium sp.]
MMPAPWRRRTFLGAGLFGSSIPLLAACSAADSPGPATSPGTAAGGSTSTPGFTPPDCVDLADHEFVRGRTYCGDRGSDGSGDADMAPLDFHGPVAAAEGSIAAWYIDAVTEWDTATGEPTRLLAPKHADTWLFASRGEHTVVPACDGTLVVHADGCRVGELPGGPGSVDGLCFVDDTRLVSLGTDDVLRLWDVPGGALLASAEVAVGGAARFLGHEPTTDALRVSTPTSLTTFALPTLEVVDERIDLPTAGTGWSLTATGDLVGITDEPPALTILGPGSGAADVVELNDGGGVLAVSATGRVAAVQGISLVVRDPDGTVATHRLQTSTYQTHAAAFSPDGRLVHVVDAVGGIQSVDVADGRRAVEYAPPRA